MTHPVYRLQIVHVEDGVVATFPGGGRVERDLIAAVTQAVLERFMAVPLVEQTAKKGVGLLVTQRLVEAQMRQAWAEMRPQFESAVAAGVAEAVAGLKRETADLARHA